MAGIDGFHRLIPDIEYRIVSLLPLSHLFEQAIGALPTLDLGADILYVRSRNPRVIFEAIREHRMTAMIIVPQFLDLFWAASSARSRSAARRRRSTGPARDRPAPPDAPCAGACSAASTSSSAASFRLFVSAGAFLPPSLQQAWEDLGVVVLQGYGATETGSGAITTWKDHPLGSVGRPIPGVEMRIADDGEILFRGPTVTRGLLAGPRGDGGGLHAGRLLPHRRPRPPRRRGPARAARSQEAT